ncbi:MAG: DUF2238 domain-containing protein [Campylobacterota bacterium]|nr:DUF2238 domain-containing protein [Campylobacterota bacterium]
MKRKLYILKKEQIYLNILSFIFSIEFLLLAINPYNRQDWLLENVLVFVFIGTFIFYYKRFKLSKLSMSLIFVFLCFHEIGAHYTYAKVPYDLWTQNIFAFSLNDQLGWERNHFDRFAHFLFGLLLTYPLREILFQIETLKYFWGHFISFNIIISSSMVFELFEWGAAETFGGNLGIAYLGTQGDVWDAHKDMLLAIIGSTIAVFCTILLEKRSISTDN